MDTIESKFKVLDESIRKTNGRFNKLKSLGYRDTVVCLSNEKYSITYNQIETMSDEDFNFFVIEAEAKLQN